MNLKKTCDTQALATGLEMMATVGSKHNESDCNNSIREAIFFIDLVVSQICGAQPLAALYQAC